MVKILLSNKVRSDVRDLDGRTPLYYAVIDGNLRITRLLLDLAPTLDKTVQEAFLEAAEAGHELVIQLLIEHGIDLSFKDSEGYTALHRAVLGSQIEILELLINTDVDWSARDNQGKTALHLAAREGEDAIAKVLLGTSEIRNLQDYDGWTALHWAVENEQDNTVQSLLDAGVDPDIKSFNAFTPLDLAESGALETMEQLLREALAARDRLAVGDTLS
jgi:ankyrin